MIYRSLFHTVTTYGIILLGNSSHRTQVFGMQSKVIGIIMGRGNKIIMGLGNKELLWGVVAEK
jgi:hypothetical protein